MKLVVSSLLVAFASSALVAAPAQADPSPVKVEAPSAQKLELARQFAVLNLAPDEFAETTRIGFLSGAEPMIDQIENDQIRAKAKAQLEAIFPKFEGKLREHLPNLVEAYAQAYAREYSTDELQQLIGFARSPVGKHYLATSDSADSDEGVEQAAEEMWNAALPVLDDFRKELCAAKAAQRVAMGDTKAKCPLAAAAETQAG